MAERGKFMEFDRGKKQVKSPQEPLEILKATATNDQAKLDAVITSLELVKREGKSVMVDIEPESMGEALPSGQNIQSTESVQGNESKIIDFTNYGRNPSGFGYKLRQDREFKKAA